MNQDQTSKMDRPPVNLPNGKRNPEYTKWYRSTPKGQAITKRWNDGGGREAMAKYRAAGKEVQPLLKRKEKKRDSNKLIKQDQCKCAECGMVFDRVESALEGFRFLPKNRYIGICGLCNEL